MNLTFEYFLSFYLGVAKILSDGFFSIHILPNRLTEEALNSPFTVTMINQEFLLFLMPTCINVMIAITFEDASTNNELRQRVVINEKR